MTTRSLRRSRSRRRAFDECLLDCATTNCVLKERSFFLKLGNDLSTNTIRIHTIAGEMSAKVGHAQVQLENGTIIDIPDAVYAPSSNRNLISLRALRENGLHIYSRQGDDGSELICVRKDHKSVAEFKDGGDGLYFGKIFPTGGVAMAYHVEGRGRSLEATMHARLGHPGKTLTRKLVNSTRGGPGKWKGDAPCDGVLGKPCEPCALGKFQAAKFDYHLPTENPEFLSHLAVDEHGPIDPPSGPFKYFMVIVCRGTRRSFVTLLSSKDLALATMVKFIIRVRTQYPERQVKKIRFDNAQEFISSAMKTFLESLGIVHETCVEYVHAQNGSAEGQIKRIQQVARTLMMGCNLPASCWGPAVLHANELLQYRPAGTMKESPKELLDGEKPSIAHLRTFGCAVYIPIPPPKRDKLGPQRSLGIYVGFDSPSIIRYLEHRTGEMFRARFADCVFDETLFPALGNPEMDPTAKLEKDRLMREAKSHLFDGKPPKVTLFPERELDPLRVEENVRHVVTLHKLAERVPHEFAPTQGVTVAEGNGKTVKNSPAAIQMGTPAKVVEPRRKAGRPPGAKDRNPRKRRTKEQKSSDKATKIAKVSDASPEILIPLAVEETPQGEQGTAEVAGETVGEAHHVHDEEDTDPDPKSVEEARQQKVWPQWRKAMDAELQSIKSRNVLGDVQELPEGCRPIGYKWVFDRKRDAEGRIARYKARLVAKGYVQQFGQDYTDTYAPVVDAATYRYLIALAARHGLETDAEDVVTAYLYGDLDHEMFLNAPEGHQEERQAEMNVPVVRLQKALYGLKQSGRVWFQRLTTYLTEQGFMNDEADAPCVFTKREGAEFAIIAIYVDDLIIIGTKRAVGRAKKMMIDEFEMKDLGRVSHCIGLQIEHFDGGIFVHQTNYTRGLLKKYSMENCNPMKTPMEVKGDRELYGDPKEGEPLLGSEYPYFSAIGELMWLANRTRPDIAFAVNILARYAATPTMRHWNGVRRILRYLKRTEDYGILYRRGSTEKLRGYADAGYKSDPNTGKSQGGYVFKLGGAAISWRSKKQTVVATSTAHAELIALYDGTREASWLHRLQKFVEKSTGLDDDPQRIPMHEDNEACIKQIKKGFVRTDATKHIDPKYRAWVAQGDGKTVDVVSVASQDNTADIFTKALPGETHWHHVRGLGMLSREETRVLKRDVAQA